MSKTGAVDSGGLDPEQQQQQQQQLQHPPLASGVGGISCGTGVTVGADTMPCRCVGAGPLTLLVSIVAISPLVLKLDD